MCNINVNNKKIWDDAFVGVNPDPNVKTMDENGEWKIATPLNNDPEIQEFGAIFEIIDNLIKNYDFKRYQIRNPIFADKYTFEPIKLYDAVLLYGPLDEILLFCVVTDIKDDGINVKYFSSDNERVINKFIKFKKTILNNDLQ